MEGGVNLPDGQVESRGKIPPAFRPVPHDHFDGQATRVAELKQTEIGAQLENARQIAILKSQMNGDLAVLETDPRQPNFVPEALRDHPLIADDTLKMTWNNLAENPAQKFFIGALGTDDKFQQNLETPAVQDFLKKVVEIYRDAYGFRPWNEYLKCSDQNCDAKIGVQSAFGLSKKERFPLKDLETGDILDKQKNCPECGSQMDLFYPPDELLKAITEDLSRDGVLVGLFDGKGELQGMSYAWMSTLEKIWEEKYEKIFSDFIGYREFVSAISPVLAGEPVDDMPLFYISDWTLLPSAKEGGNHIHLLREIYLALAQCAAYKGKEGEIDVLGYTDDGVIKRIYQSLGVPSIYSPPGSKLNVVHTPMKEYIEHIKSIH